MDKIRWPEAAALAINIPILTVCFVVTVGVSAYMLLCFDYASIPAVGCLILSAYLPGGIRWHWQELKEELEPLSQKHR